MERRKNEGKKKERKEKKEEENMSDKFYLLSRIHRDRAFGFCRNKRQSPSTQRELRVGTRIRGFLQTPRGRGFPPALVVLGLRVI